MKKTQTLVIAVGGKGRRIANHFHGIHFRGPKVLFPVGQKPLISYLIDLALTLKFRRVYLLTSHFEVNIRRYLDTYYRGSKNVVVVHGGSMGRRYGVPYLLYSLRKSLTKPFIYTDGNILFAPDLLKHMQSGRLGKNTITLVVSKRDYALTHSCVTVINGEVKDIHARLPKRRRIQRTLHPNSYCSMGIMVIHPKTFSVCHGFARKLDLDNVIEELHSKDSESIQPLIYSKEWLALHQKQDLDGLAKFRYSEVFRSLTSVSTLTGRRLRHDHHGRTLPIDRRKRVPH